MSFSISFLGEPVFYDEQTPMATGELVLGEFKENFVASLYQWNKADYEAQWRDAIKAILKGSKSALAVWYVAPEFSDNLEWWPMYREGNVIHVQNHLLFYDQLTRPFSQENMLSFIRDRRTINEDGERISEWSVELSEVEEFARALAI
ncbi:hypothetical protein [Edaphobacter bradus]|uniref:hypothetical protein n=1 Tax=Edaphobacter bradus TaxID=2259016 RepID=UPI0021DFB79E|nr:hypothetical protein [Edaphobacter bradus]